MSTRWGKHEIHGKLRLSESPIADEGVRLQLAQLFGESLFGPWPQLREHVGEPWHRRTSRKWLLRLGVLLLLSIGVVFVRSLLQPGLKHQADHRRDHYVQELKTFIGDGDLDHASRFLTLVEAQSGGKQTRDLDSTDPELDLIVVTEAALYRYFDASPERLRRIRPYLDDSGQSAPLRQIAALTVLSREERADKVRELERLRNDLPDRSDIDYLLATALEHRGDALASREAWERSAKLEPAWLGHRFEQVWFELRQDRVESATQIAGEILRVDPDCIWSNLAIECLGLPRDAATGSMRGDAAASSVTPVQIHFQILVQAILAAGRHESSLAKELLGNAAAAVNYQAPFLFDAFDWCIGENEPDLARELANMPQWPRDYRVARAKLARLPRAWPNVSKRPLRAAREQSAAPAAVLDRTPSEAQSRP